MVEWKYYDQTDYETMKSMKKQNDGRMFVMVIIDLDKEW